MTGLSCSGDRCHLPLDLSLSQWGPNSFCFATTAQRNIASGTRGRRDHPVKKLTCVLVHLERAMPLATAFPNVAVFDERTLRLV